MLLGRSYAEKDQGCRRGTFPDPQPRATVGTVVNSSQLLRNISQLARYVPSLGGDPSEGVMLPKRCQAQRKHLINATWVNH